MDDTEFDAEKARDCLLKEIVGCYNCQPWEGGPVWLGPKSDLMDLLIDCEIEEEHWDEVLEDLRCPSCGTELTSIGDEVEVKSEYDKKVEEILEKAKSTKLIEKLFAFSEFLKEYPYLGLCDPGGIGNDIMERIAKWNRYKLEPKEWYRARKINEESRIFSSEEMGAPDPQKTYIWEGRYNHTGQNFLYLSDDPETAFQEIREGKQNLCAVQKFKATEAITVLDLRQDYFNIDPEVELLAIAVMYNGFISQVPSRVSSWKPEYFVPRFVADCARKEDYEGILFSSIVRFGGENLVVFPPKISVFMIEGECVPFYLPENSIKSRIDLGTMLIHFKNKS